MIGTNNYLYRIIIIFISEIYDHSSHTWGSSKLIDSNNTGTSWGIWGFNDGPLGRDEMSTIINRQLTEPNRYKGINNNVLVLT